MDLSPSAPTPIPWAEEQRLLGVGVRIQRRPSRHLAHAPALEAATRALAAGMSPSLVEERLGRLRQRLWRAPFWRDRFAVAGGSPDDLRALSDLEPLPLLDRETLAEVWRDALDADGDPELHLATTSGSTGLPILVPRSGYDGLHMWAVIEHWVRTLGIDLPPRPRLALLCTLPGGLAYSVRTPQWRNGALHRIAAVRGDAMERLARVAPAILSTDPAGLHFLGARTTTARLVLSSATTLHRRPAGAPIVNYYATTELGPIAWECLSSPGAFHVLAPDVVVESIAGELVVSRLRDSVLPLLRYRTGDRGEVASACPCGANVPVIVGFLGRDPAPFRRPDGAEIDAWSLGWLFKDIPLSRFSLTQITAERFELRLEPGSVIEPALFVERLVRSLVRLGWGRPTVVLVPWTGPWPKKPVPFTTRVP